MFGIANATGLIFIARELDLTSVGFYTLTVRVTDSGFPPLMATASARISLILSDFSQPKFSQNEYQTEVTGKGWGDGGERCEKGDIDGIKKGWEGWMVNL